MSLGTRYMKTMNKSKVCYTNNGRNIDGMDDPKSGHSKTERAANDNEGEKYEGLVTIIIKKKFFLNSTD